MTTIRAEPAEPRATRGTAIRASETLWRVLLACGALSSIVYVGTDILGGLRYPGYDFTSQVISELGAIGAPTSAFVAQLFTVSAVLTLAFGIGVFRQGRTSRTLRITGALLIGMIVAGQGFALFPMQQREVTTLAHDAPHIITGAVVVVLMLLAIGIGAFALGKRFRVYSFLTIAVLVVSGVALGIYTPKVAAHEPTPGLGIVERINVYAIYTWIAVLSIALLRQQTLDAHPQKSSSPGAIHRPRDRSDSWHSSH
jgi:hypothetical membrane protein